MANRFYVSRVKGKEAEASFGPFVGQVLSYDYIVELATDVYCDLIADYDAKIGVGAWFEDAVGGIMFDFDGRDICYIGLVAVADNPVSSDRFNKDIWNRINEEVDS